VLDGQKEEEGLACRHGASHVQTSTPNGLTSSNVT